ncbi:FAD-dependent monooxygenase [Sphingomonas profundi]|uniref:FAD-dependent monooxygenase n=1 Tax=Alterirhizorhabdus profundi TaxID=2681549 RepID=UPI0012E88C24|nr:FAD-dependent monooxygenase [Sphingomonas profundi]
MRIAIVGGGPGGLFFARLYKRHRPDAQVRIFEQNPDDATFGFGVTLGGSSLGQLAAADPETTERLSAAMVFDEAQVIHLNGTDVPIHYAKPGGSIARLRLLQILREAAREVGVEVAFDTRVASSRDLDGYDLIVAADGVNSTIRQEHGDAFGTECRILTNHFAWYGVGRAMSPNALVFRDALGGRFVAHYYAYTPEMSTFVGECDDETWTAAGLDAMSDADRRAVLEDVFAPELAGAPLIENRSIWRQFPAITNARWHHANIVLIGDALRSAHFSIGSGTRLAMEDAQALFEAMAANDAVADALPAFVARRQPARDRFGEAAERSFEWYERIATGMAQQPIDFAYDFMTRTGRVDDARLESYAPSFARLYRDSRASMAATS